MPFSLENSVSDVIAIDQTTRNNIIMIVLAGVVARVVQAIIVADVYTDPPPTGVRAREID